MPAPRPQGAEPHRDAVADGTHPQVPPVPEALRADLPAEAVDRLQRYAALLAGPGTRWGLLGPREAPRLWERHVADALVLVPLVPRGASVVDVGSGAGLPGVPLAVTRPDVAVELREPMARRTRFLHLVVDELGLPATVRRARAEDGADPLVDVVVCRAVAPLERLVPLVLPLLRPGGLLLAVKGRRADREVDDASARLAELGVRRATVETPRGPGGAVGSVVVVEAPPPGRRRRERGS